MSPSRTAAAPGLQAEATAADAASRAPAGFSAQWLQQREPFDAQARGIASARLRLVQRLQAFRATRPQSASAPWRVIDLACGTGANLRWLAPRLGGRQQWLVVDNDAALLASWPQRLASRKHSAVPPGQPLHWAGSGFDCAIIQRQLDLAQPLECLPWAAAHLVSASALLDLVSAHWLQHLLAQLQAQPQAQRPALLLALSVDGRHHWAPKDQDDALVGPLFAAHQQRDKGFGGPGLGASAVPLLREGLAAAGYRVYTARSDWWLDGRQGQPAWALQQALVQGMAAAAAEQAPAQAARLQAWQARRLALGPASSLRVGHLDLLALPRP